MIESNREALLKRLRRAEGQMAAVGRMIEAGEDCSDVLLQIAAVRGALGKIGQALLRSHMETCVTEAFTSGNPEQRERRIDELTEVFARFGGMTSK